MGIQLKCPQFPNTTGTEIQLIKDNKMIPFPTENSSNVFDLMGTLEKELKGDTLQPTHQEDISSYKVIIEQLKTIDGEYPYKLSDDYKTVTFSGIPDHPGHNLTLRYDGKRQGFHIENHSLPDKCGALRGKTIGEFLENFKSELTMLEEFYGNLNDIDELCFVIAPVPVTTKDSYRIFKFSEFY